MERDDPELGATQHGWKRTERPDDTFFVINYIIIAVLNLVQFSLTIYGMYRDNVHCSIKVGNNEQKC